MTRYDIIRMAQEATEHLYDADSVRLQGIVLLALDAGEQAERDRTKRLVEDMQNELQTLRDRLAKQKPRMWVYRDNPGLTTMREPSNPDLWEPLGPIV